MRISNINLSDEYVVPGTSEHSHETIYDSRNSLHPSATILIPDKNNIPNNSLEYVYSSAEKFVQKAIESSDVEFNLQYINSNNKECKFNESNTQFVHKKVLIYYASVDKLNTIKDNEQNQLKDVVKVINTNWKEKYTDVECPEMHKTLNMNDIFSPNSNVSNTNIKLLDDKEIDNNKDYALNQQNKNKDNNHSTLDLTFDSNHNKEDSIKSEESSLTSESLILSYKPTYVYFPHGIINPNYPGFQHLAHTLSEHFVDNNNSFSSYSSFEEYDSDITDYEMDISKDSFESLNQDQDQELHKVTSLDNLNINNNMNEDLDDNLLLSEDKYFKESDRKCEGDQFKDKNILRKNDTKLIENHISLKTEENSKLVMSGLKKDNYSSDKSSSITPDILIENNHKYYKDKNYDLQIESEMLQENNNLIKKDGRPDLLCGVSPPFLKSTEVICSLIQQHPIVSIQIDDLNLEKKSFNCDEINSLGNTPVDIIGDFGQEVEREFDLLVTGYKRLNGEKKNFSKLQLQSRKLIVTDAAFTYIGDKIDFNRYDKSLDKHTNEQKNNETLTLSPLVKNLDKNHKTCWNSNQKISYDEKQLPPVAIEYKKYQPKKRLKAESLNYKKNEKGPSKNTISQTRIKHNNINGDCTKSSNTSSRLRRTAFKQERSQLAKHTENSELYQYRQLISDKEAILKNSRYVKYEPSWTQYLTRKDKTTTENCKDNSNFNNNAELLTTGLLELFQAYKIGTETLDQSTLQQHLHMAKEIEKKRQNDRKEIHRRLALGNEYQNIQDQTDPSPNSSLISTNGYSMNIDNHSDTETNSSDSETCVKLMRSKPTQLKSYQSTHQPIVEIETIASTSRLNHDSLLATTITNKENTSECDFFTKQAKLQIETRMALSQAKVMAKMHMKTERNNRRLSPITTLLRESLESIGVHLNADTRRMSRQMLTNLHLSQLKLLVKQLNNHIVDLNEILVTYLIERDELHVNQDLRLADIEKLSHYIGAK